MITLSINGTKVKCPGCYEELTTGTFQNVFLKWDMDEPDFAKRDYFKLFSIINNIDAEIKRTPENEAVIWDAVRWFLYQPFKFSAQLPKVLKIGDKIVTVPRSCGPLSSGQNINLKQVIDKSHFMEEGISKAVAICLQPIYDESKYDYDRAMELEKSILEMPIYLTHPVGFFLLQTVRKDGWRPTNGLQRRMVSLKQILKRMLPHSRRYISSGSLTTYP